MLFGGPSGLMDTVPPVVTAIKADMRCAAVAAASILAKTSRDAIMMELAGDYPDYGWHQNKGYSAPEQIGRATSELQSLMRISYAVFCLKKKIRITITTKHTLL